MARAVFFQKKPKQDKLKILLLFQTVVFAALIAAGALFRLHLPSIILGFLWSSAFAWTSLRLTLKLFPQRSPGKGGRATLCGPNLEGSPQRAAALRASRSAGPHCNGQSRTAAQKTRLALPALMILKWAAFGAILFILLKKTKTGAFLVGSLGLLSFWLLFAFLFRFFNEERQGA